MKKLNEIIEELTIEQKQSLIAHLNEIYECEQLSEHELNIIHLAYLWANGCVSRNEDYWPELNEELAGVSLDTFEITIEDEPGGTNLDIMYNFYDFDKMIEIIERKI